MGQADFPPEVVQAVLGQLSAAVGHNEDAPGSLGDVAVFFASYILN